MTFGQLKSSYFEECDGVLNSKLWIVELWRLDNWKSRTLRNAMVYITLNCGLLRYDVWTIEKLVLWGMRWCTNSKLWIVEIWRLDNWKAHTLRNAMEYITPNCGLLRYDAIRVIERYPIYKPSPRLLITNQFLLLYVCLMVRVGHWLISIYMCMCVCVRSNERVSTTGSYRLPVLTPTDTITGREI